MAHRGSLNVGDWQPTASNRLKEQAKVLDTETGSVKRLVYGPNATTVEEFPIYPTTQEALATGKFGKEPTRSTGRKGGKSKKSRRMKKRTTRKQRK